MPGSVILIYKSFVAAGLGVKSLHMAPPKAGHTALCFAHCACTSVSTRYPAATLLNSIIASPIQ